MAHLKAEGAEAGGHPGWKAGKLRRSHVGALRIG